MIQFKHFKFLTFKLIVAGIIASMMISCSGNEEDYIPKPRGYFRIDLPEKKYRIYNSDCPFTFETPDYAFVHQIGYPAPAMKKITFQNHGDTSASICRKKNIGFTIPIALLLSKLRTTPLYIRSDILLRQ